MSSGWPTSADASQPADLQVKERMKNKKQEKASARGLDKKAPLGGKAAAKNMPSRAPPKGAKR